MKRKLRLRIINILGSPPPGDGAATTPRWVKSLEIQGEGENSPSATPLLWSPREYSDLGVLRRAKSNTYSAREDHSGHTGSCGDREGGE